MYNGVEKREVRIDVYLGQAIPSRPTAPWGATDYSKFLPRTLEVILPRLACGQLRLGWRHRSEHPLANAGSAKWDGVQPKVIVLMAGTNNLVLRTGNVEAAVEEVTQGIQDDMPGKRPKSVIILMAITPRNDSPHATVAINKINNTLATHADGKAIRFLNINNALADESEKLRKEMSDDGLHLCLKGIKFLLIWF